MLCWHQLFNPSLGDSWRVGASYCFPSRSRRPAHCPHWSWTCFHWAVCGLNPLKTQKDQTTQKEDVRAKWSKDTNRRGSVVLLPRQQSCWKLGSLVTVGKRTVCYWAMYIALNTEFWLNRVELTEWCMCLHRRRREQYPCWVQSYRFVHGLKVYRFIHCLIDNADFRVPAGAATLIITKNTAMQKLRPLAVKKKKKKKKKGRLIVKTELHLEEFMLSISTARSLP